MGEVIRAALDTHAYTADQSLAHALTVVAAASLLLEAALEDAAGAPVVAQARTTGAALARDLRASNTDPLLDVH